MEFVNHNFDPFRSHSVTFVSNLGFSGIFFGRGFLFGYRSSMERLPDCKSSTRIAFECNSAGASKIWYGVCGKDGIKLKAT
ncbi:hypothetical protein Hanom_Chr14g01301031 [Helianthus anomalus]